MTLDINSLPITGVEPGQKPRYVVRYTLDGEVLCKNIKGAFVAQPLRTVELGNQYDHPEYVKQLSRFYALVCAVRDDQPTREVPLVKKDVLSFMCFSKKECTQLQLLGLIKEVLIPLVDTTTGKNMGSRNVLFFTPQGRAFVRKYVDPKYAITENT